MLSTPGRRQSADFIESRFNGAMAMQHSSMVDECYISVGGNIDQGLRDKICRGEYVDFARLLPRNKLGNNPSEQKMELINKGGQTFFVPANDKDSLSVSSFHCWEQAFRVYSNIYLQDHQDRAAELIQYNHIICTASASFVWENVYNYDKEFRQHLSMFPNRSWAIILQQAWSLCLKDRITPGQHRFNGAHSSNRFKKEVCNWFNQGLCTAGRSCKFDHRCLECGKFGHGKHICQSAKQSIKQNDGATPMANNN